MNINNIPSALLNLDSLKCKVAVYVPSTVDVDKPVDNSEHVARAARLLSDCFGGATSAKVKGFWVSEDRKLIAENTTIVYSFCTEEQAEKYMEEIIHLCTIIRYQMRQEAVALEFNGKMYFI